MLKNLRKLQALGDAIRGELKDPMVLRVDCFFVFHKSRILCSSKLAKSWVKVIDADNRLKSARDRISKAIEIDDKFIFTGLCEKVVCEKMEEEQVIIRLSLSQVRTLDSLLEEMNLSPLSAAEWKSARSFS